MLIVFAREERLPSEKLSENASNGPHVQSLPISPSAFICRVSGSKSSISGLGFQMSGLGFRAEGSGVRTEG